MYFHLQKSLWTLFAWFIQISRLNRII